ncbi:MAG TPA: hypothetical protein PKL26_05000 [Methanolinea sp.]|nr:hypothetical protein [Methanolinea sp.]
MNSHREQARTGAGIIPGTSFSLKGRWLERTKTLPDEQDGKPRDIALCAIRKSFEEFREEAKKEVRTGDAGTLMFRLLDQIRQFIRFYELAEEPAKSAPADTGPVDRKDSRESGYQDQEQTGPSPHTGRRGINPMKLLGARTKPVEEAPASAPSFRREQLEMLVGNIGDFLGVMDDMLPKLLPKPEQKPDLPRDSLEAFQGMLAIMLEADDRRFTEAMRSQREVICSLFGKYGISTVLFEEEPDRNRKGEWFEERLVSPEKFPTIRTASPALVRNDMLICRGTVYIPQRPR